MIKNHHIIAGVILILITLLYPISSVAQMPGFPDNVDSADCTTDVLTTVWGAQVGWSSDSVCADRCMPLVGDLDGDSNPEIVCFSSSGESVYRNDITRVTTMLVYDGVTKNLKATITSPSPVTSYDAAAYGLVRTSSGTGLIVVACYDFKLRAYDITASDPNIPYWVSDVNYGSYVGDWAVTIGFADFNMDGHPELYIRNKIYDAETGRLLVSASGNNTGSSYAHWTHESHWKLSSPMAADVYGDARPELILGNQIFEITINDTTGSGGNVATPVRQTPPPVGTTTDGNTQVADFNLDGHLDVFITLRTTYATSGMVYGYVWDVYNNTTSYPISINTSWSGKSIPLIADINNDGMMEVIIQCGATDNNKIRAYRYDTLSGAFTFLWGMQPDEDSYSNSITAFDFNQDGLLELLICDQSMVRIVNGSGKSHITHNDTVPVYVMASFPFSETTIMQYPVIADVDNDGHAEIVFVGNNSLNILESSAAPWAPARKVWNQYMYNITCVNEDLTVPQSLFNNAYAFTDPQGVMRRPYNNFLQQATTIDRYGRPFYAVPDLVMDSASVNYGDDSVTITFHYCNQGDNTVNAPYTCSVSAPGLTEPIYTDTIEASMPTDSCGQGQLTLANSLLCGVADLDSVTVTLRTGGQPECDSTNNSVTVALHPTFRDTIAVSICDNQSYTIWDTAYNTSGYHIHTVHHATGCDSIIYLHLSILPSPVLHHIPDTVILPGQSLTLHAGGADIYTWQNSSGTVLSNDSVTTVSPSASTTYYLTAFNQGGNLVYNGDFELGNTGFSTAYTYSSRFLSAGYYCVDTNAHNHHSGFTGSHDHTSGSGNYMMANGEYLVGTNVWTQVINVQPLTDYAFSVWGSNLSPYPEQAMAQLQFSVNNVQLGDIHTIPTALETWTQFYEVWNSGNNNVATLTISNLSTIAIGNDFGIDDIHFEPLTTCRASDTIHVYVGNHHDTTICQSQLPFFWNDVSFDHAGAKTATLTDLNGDDSLVVMNVIVIPTKNNTLYDTICSNHSLVFNGNAYDTAGVYDDTLVASSGCDSIVTLHLFVLDTTVGDTTAIVCDSLIWHGATYTESTDTPTHISTNAVGCDSTTTLHLTVRHSTTGDTTAIVCDSLVWRDSTYRVSTTYVQHLTNTAGCDSTFTLNLTVNRSDSITYNLMACDSYTWDVDGNTYTSDTSLSAVLSNGYGCDSIVYLHLSILPSPVLHHIPDTVITPGQSLTLHAGGADIYTWLNSSGTLLSNDSVITVSPSTSTTYYLTAFNQGGNSVYNGDFELGNTGFSTAYNYSTDLFPVGNYCVGTNAHDYHRGFTGSHDHTSGSGNFMIVNGASGIGTNLWTQVINVQPHTDYAFSVWGTNLSSYPEQYMAQLQFSINGVQLGDIFQIPTALDNWTQFYEVWNSGDNNVATLTILNMNTLGAGNDFGIDDIYFASLTTCQSSDTIHVYVGHHHDTTICQSQLPFLWNGVSFDHAGAKTATLTDINGDDSIVIMNVIVIPTKSNTLYDTICSNHPFVQNGNLYNTTGIYNDTLVASSGCDSIVTLHLFARDTTTGDTAANVCDSFLWYGATYTASTDTPTHTSTNAVGCDSTTTLHLTVRLSTTGDTTASVCDSLVWRDSTCRVSTTYVQHLSNTAGCDSTFTLNLTVNNSTLVDTFAITSEILVWRDSTYRVSTVDTSNLTSSLGCDSLTVLHLFVTGYPDNVDSADCTTDVVSTAWGAQVGWSSDTICADRCMPLVGDLDGDGIPEIVCFSRNGETTYRSDITRVTTMLVYDGATKNLKATVTSPSPVSSYDATAYGLVKTSSGVGLIVLACYDLKLRAFDITATNPNVPYWVSDINYGSSVGDWAVNIGFADFNMDGHPELYVRNKIYNAETGNLLVSVSSSNSGSSYAHWSHDTRWKLSAPMAADVYGDAKPELILGNQAYEISIPNTLGSSGNAATLLRQTTPPSGVPSDGHTQVADFNLDGHLDVFVSLRDTYSSWSGTILGYVWDVFNNTTSSPFAINTSWSGKSIPLIADIDNDGMMEVIIQGDASGSYKYLAYRYNPQSASFTNLWGMQPDEDSYSNSITAFDFNQDGLLELLISDQSMVRIVNGSGKSHITHNDTVPVYVMTSFPFSETTIMQYPVIADVDDDGHAEIVFVGNNRLNILESSAAPWAPARKVWNQYMYNVTCVNEDLTVPQSLFNNAYAFTDPQGVVRRPYNNFLQQATTIDRYGRPFYAVPDLVMDSASVNYGDDSVTITFHYCNQGDNTVNAPYTCSVSAAGLTEPIYTDTIEAAMPMDSCGQGLLTIANSLLCGVADLDSVTVTLQTAGQPECDSTNNSVKVALHPTFRDTIAASICDNQPYSFGDTAYNTSGYHSHTVHHATGCDSLHTLDLAVRATSAADTAAIVCDSFTWYDTTYTASTDTPTHISTNTVGCDSTTTLHLTVRHSTSGDTTATVCDSLVWRDSIYRASTTYVQHFTNTAGCDSTFTLNLTVNRGDSITLNLMACDSYTWDVDGNTYTSDTSLSAVLSNGYGCDSIVYLHLSILPSPVLHHIPDTVITPGQSLTLHAGGANIYTWLNSSGTLLSNDSVITVSPSTSTTYYLTAFNQGGNSVYNGDFELGNTGFSTAYNYSTDLYPEGNYCVDTNAHNHHSGFTGSHDHTSGSGNYMIVNGASGIGTNLWTQVINVQPHTDYAFSVWGTNLSSYAEQYMAQLQFSVNNVQLGDIFQIPTALDNWTQFYEVWNSGDNNVATLTILNMNTLGAGNDFGIDDIYFASLTTCQSSDTIHVYVGHHHDTTICQSQLPFLWNGVSFDHAGAKTATLTDHNGNDSIVIMNVIVIPTKSNTLYDTICNNHPFVQNGNLYNTTGIYNDTLVASSGCDSIVTLHLFARDTTTGDTAANVCDSFLWYGATYTASTDTPTHTSTNAVGCDSTTTLHLTVRLSTTGDTTASVCDSLIWYGTTYTASTNTPAHHSTNAVGCDSTTTLHLTVRYSNTGDTTASVCDSLIWYGTTYTASTNTPTHHSTNAAGCDSTTTLHLTVRYSTTGDTTANTCDTLIWYNQTFTQSNNQATHTFTNSANCDSTVTLHLTVRHSTAGTYYDTVIENLLPRSFNGHSFTNDTANVLITIPNAVGCDSNITYHLHVHHNIFVVVDSNLCNDSLPVTWNGIVFDTLVSRTDTMTRSVTFTAATGADSTVRMNLYVHPLYDHHQYEEICDKQTFAFGDSVYAVAGDYTDTLRSIHGCDSLSTLHLVVHDIYEQHYADTICHDMTYEWRGHTVHSTADNLTEDFILRDTLSSVYGCDSVDILTLIKMALPQIALVADTDCSISGYRLSVTATAPLSAGEAPRRMPYIHWSALPADNSLLGQEGSDTVKISPVTTTQYLLYADYHKTPLCPATDSITLDRIIVPEAILKVNPTTLSLDNLHFVAQDKTLSYHTQRHWYLDGMLYPSTSSILEEDANPEADSVTIGLEVDNRQCRDSAEITLRIQNVIIYVPNIFSPAKEDNNIFRLVTRGVTEGELHIYDRFGALVFHTDDLSQGWDGTHDGQPCQQRAYVWKLRYRTVDQPDADQVKTGTVTLIR